MYHDEFARMPRPAKPVPNGEDLLPKLPFQIGGGLSLGLAASMNQTVSLLLFYLGGLLPLVTCSCSIAVNRASEWLARLASKPEAARPLAAPLPELLTGHHLRASRRVRSLR